jgi:IS30 family transposase
LDQEEGIAVSHEWIYLYVYTDKRHGGDLYKHLRCLAVGGGSAAPVSGKV